MFKIQTLLDDTIYNNIMHARTDATEAEVLDAAERSMVLDFAWELPNGMQTRVGKGGYTLSPEEQKRIFIARSFLKNTWSGSCLHLIAVTVSRLKLHIRYPCFHKHSHRHSSM